MCRILITSSESKVKLASKRNLDKELARVSALFSKVRIIDTGVSSLTGIPFQQNQDISDKELELIAPFSKV